MKNHSVLLFVLLFSVTIFSQTEEDYTSALNLVSEAFNNQKASLIHQKFNQNLKSQIKETDFKTTIDSIYAEKGKMSGYDLILDEEKEKNYLVEFENSSMLLLIHLTKEGEITLFKIKEY